MQQAPGCDLYRSLFNSEILPDKKNKQPDCKIRKPKLRLFCLHNRIHYGLKLTNTHIALFTN